MSISSARRAAEEIIDRFDVQLGNRRPIVDVEAIAQRLRVPVLFDDIPPDKDGFVSGMLITRGGRSMILVNKQIKSAARRRFTIAHELGHKMLRHPVDEVHADGGFAIHKRSLRSSDGSDYREIEANQFAAALLMPGPLVHQSIAQFGRSSLSDLDVEVLCDQFGVSEQAMLIRLSVLGLND